MLTIIQSSFYKILLLTKKMRKDRKTKSQRKLVENKIVYQAKFRKKGSRLLLILLLRNFTKELEKNHVN